MILGADLSHHQGRSVDFNKMKEAGVQFVFFKCTDFALPKWNGVDDTFFWNVNKAQKAGLLVGAYHWWTSDSKYSALEHAHLFWSTASQVKLDLPPALDVEVGGNPKMLWSARLSAALYEIEGLFNRTPIIYTSNGIWKYNACNYEIFKDYPLWLAQYKVSVPTVPAPWDKWSFWQYSATFTDPIAKDSVNFGINRYEARALDLNWFNGSLKELKEL